MKQVLISEELLEQVLGDMVFLSRLANVDHNERPSVVALLTALEQPEVEPVAEVYQKLTGGNSFPGTAVRILETAPILAPGTKLYISPQLEQQGMELPERHDLGREVFDKICEMETEDRFTTIADVKEAVRCIVFSVRQALQPAQQLEVVLRKVMSRIAELLDEDQFAEIENIVLGAGVAPQTAPVQGQQPVHPRHPVVVRWRNDGIEACAGIADAYGNTDASRDMRAMITAQPHKAEPAPQTIKQEPVLLLDEVIDAITDTIWGKQKVTSMYPTYRMYARTVEAATLLNQVPNKQG